MLFCYLYKLLEEVNTEYQLHAGVCVQVYCYWFIPPSTTTCPHRSAKIVAMHLGTEFRPWNLHVAWHVCSKVFVVHPAMMQG